MRFACRLVVVACLAAGGCARPAPPPAAEPVTEEVGVTVPFTLTAQNLIVVKAVLNNGGAVDLMLHTAASDVSLTEDAVRRIGGADFTGTARITSWGGPAGARVSTGNRLQLGDLRRDAVRVFEVKQSGVGTDGKFGLDFFGGKVVEVDFDRQRLIIHDRLPATAADWHRLAVEAKDGELFAEAACVIGGADYPHRFLLHTGYSGGVLLDDAFVAASGIDGKLAVDKESKLTDSFGKSITVKNVTLPALVLGGERLDGVPAGFFSGAVGMQKLSVLGGAVLSRFNLLFDPANGAVYLRRRS